MRSSRRIMAYTAAAIYAAAALDGAVEGFLPGDPPFAVVPVLAVLMILAVLLVLGPRLPRWALEILGPLGVTLVAYAMATTPGASDAAVLYALPVVWSTLFFGRRGAVTILTCVALAQTVALLELPPSSSYPGRWIDVMVSAGAIAVVILALERRNAHLLRRLADEARTDPLTGLLNRRGFEERAAVELAHARREGRPIALASIDIDNFKHVNDEWGHDAGDRVLALLGQLLRTHCREIDVVARLGGDEFTVLMPGSELHVASDLAERIRRELERGKVYPPSVRISAGVVSVTQPTSMEQLLQQADTRLYDAKRSGRNRTVAAWAGEACRPVEPAR